MTWSTFTTPAMTLSTFTTLPELLPLILAAAVLYKGFFLSILMPAINAYHAKQPYWSELKNRAGSFCVNAQDEVSFTTAVGLHHILGGLMCVYGVYSGDTRFWIAGACVEIGFEVADVGAIVLGTFPYNGQLRPELKSIILLHHAPGLLCGVPAITNGLHTNSHVQAIVSSLMLAGGLSVTIQALVYTKDFDREMGWVFFYQLIGTGSLCFARIYTFPTHLFLLVNELRQAQDSDWRITALFVVSGLGMMRFNVMMLRINVSKCYKFLLAWIDQRKTTASTKALKRRESTKEALNAIAPRAVGLRRQTSSMLASMMLPLDVDSLAVLSELDVAKSKSQ